MFKYLVFVALPLALLAAACDSSNTDALTDQPWALTEIVDAAGDSRSPIETSVPTLSFDNLEVTGSASCNRYFGSVEIDGSAIHFGPLGSTEMYCADPGVMDQEVAYLEALASAETWSVDGETLSLSSGDTTLLVFTSGATDPPKRRSATS